jgi:hypothetical protein
MNVTRLFAAQEKVRLFRAIQRLAWGTGRSCGVPPRGPTAGRPDTAARGRCYQRAKLHAVRPYPITLLLSLLLTGCSSLQQRNQPLKQLYSGEVVCYSWTETLGAEELENRGGLVFLKKGEIIYSRAWHFDSEVEWPPVEGAGCLIGNTLHMVYRTVFGQPGHEFYHTYCRFELLNGGRDFKCAFMQKATPEPETALSPGAARGSTVRHPNAEFQGHLESVQLLADALEPRVVPDGHCPVLPLWPASAVVTQRNGKAVKLCCLSCLDVFSLKPEAFDSLTKKLE